MNDLLEKAAKLKQEVEQARRERDMAEGAKKQILDRLRTEYGCLSLRAARELLAEMKLKAGELEEKARLLFSALEQKYGAALLNCRDS